MCNASNHSPSCRCGFGGDGHSGSSANSLAGFGHASSFRYQTTSASSTWFLNSKPTHESFTKPQAKCPVCGQAVYYYKSPYGGSAYFDELGISWPKHPCTDTMIRSRPFPMQGNIFSITKNTGIPVWQSQGWLPVIVAGVITTDTCLLLKLKGLKGEPTTFFGCPIESGVNVGSPTFVRNTGRDSDKLEVSTITSDGGHPGVIPKTLIGYPECYTENGFHDWKKAIEGDSKAQNRLGMIFSFANDTPLGRAIGSFPDGCNWAAALKWFTKSADSGEWAAHNNLGVMYLNGYGVERDEARTFQLFQIAARQQEPIPIRHLADCYRDGIGTHRDMKEAGRLYERASRLEGEISI